MARGGARPGAGRPKGSMTEASKLRMAAKSEFQQRVAKVVDRLFNAQLSLAEGARVLLRVDKNPKTGKPMPAVIVEDPDEIKAYLDGDLADKGGSYYFITTKEPDNRALDSLLDRTFGRPEQALDITSDGEKVGLFGDNALTVKVVKEGERDTDTDEPGGDDGEAAGDQPVGDTGGSLEPAGESTGH